MGHKKGIRTTASSAASRWMKRVKDRVRYKTLLSVNHGMQQWYSARELGALESRRVLRLSARVASVCRRPAVRELHEGVGPFPES
jgi:hypothetical protein